MLRVLFALAPLAMVLAPSQVAAQIQWPPLPNNLTNTVLQVAFAISPPCAANNTFCQALTTTVIPRCQRMRGDPGCWCGNHDPLHFCAICMSNPSNNETSADQTQAAMTGHQNFHLACNAYEELINGTAVVSTTSVQSSTSATATPTVISSNSDDDNKAPIGAIVGGAVGGAVGLVAVAGIIYLISLWIKGKNERQSDVGPSSMSYMGSENKSPIGFGAPYPHASMTHYGSGHVSPLPQVGYNGPPNMPEPMNPQPGPHSV
ncbi:hypothetical protein FRC12_008234 [Ceratobasidium sp. 428]|nr:hypothetical protein FRC12_008234 [Ceratobasidium sp. 428]